TAFEGTEGLKQEDFTDGLATTVLVVEAADAVPWTKPAELPYDAGKPLPKLGGMSMKGFIMVTGDGAVHFVPARFNESVLRDAITRNDGKSISLEDLEK